MEQHKQGRNQHHAHTCTTYTTTTTAKATVTLTSPGFDHLETNRWGSAAAAAVCALQDITVILASAVSLVHLHGDRLPRSGHNY